MKRHPVGSVELDDIERHALAAYYEMDDIPDGLAWAQASIWNDLWASYEDVDPDFWRWVTGRLGPKVVRDDT